MLERPIQITTRRGLPHRGGSLESCAALLALLLLSVMGCRRAAEGAAEKPGEGKTAQNANPAPSSSPQGGPSAAPELEPSRVLAGTGIRVALPKGAVRAGRTLTFKVPGQSALFALSHSRSGSPPLVAVKQAAKVYGLKQEFAATGEAFELSQTPQRFAIAGDMSEDMLGERGSGLAGLIAARNEAEHLFFLRASFLPSERQLVEAVARTIDIQPDAALEPLKVHGLKLQIADGYELKPGQLNPIVVLPKGAAHVSGEPNLDIRVTDAGHVSELFDDVVAKFKADPAQVACEPAVTKDPRGVAATFRHQICRFASGQGPYHVRTDVLEDGNGGVVAIVTEPDAVQPAAATEQPSAEGQPSSAEHRAAFEQMVSTLRLGDVPAL